MHPVNRPEVIVPSASEKIDDKGALTDEKTRQKIRELLESLIAWTKRLEK
jgi:chromate reductase